MINEQLNLEKDLYAAWCAYYEMMVGTGPDSDEEAAQINEQCRLTYERAYDELGPRWTQHVIGAARRDCGEDI